MFILYFDIYFIAFRYCVLILKRDILHVLMYVSRMDFCMCSEGNNLFLGSMHNNEPTRQVTTNELQTKTKSYLVC